MRLKNKILSSFQDNHQQKSRKKNKMTGGGCGCKTRTTTCCRRGPKGDMGLQGPTGPTGVMGPRGIQGETGPTGVEGPRGHTGPTGVEGPQGVTGPTGMVGPKGPMGQSFCDCGNFQENSFKERVVPVGSRIHLELEKQCFRLCGRVPVPACAELCTLQGTVIKVVVPLPEEPLETAVVDKECSVGIWSCCARRNPAEGQPQPGCGVSNSGDVRLESFQVFPEDNCALVTLCLVNNFDERLFTTNSAGVIIFNPEFRLELVEFILCGKFDGGDDHECPVPQ